MLEESNQTLKWGINQEQAWRVSKPQHYLGKDDFSRIKWTEKILGGLRCGILAYLPENQSLERLHVWLIPPENTYPNTFWFAYMKIFNHLLKEIGSPEMKPVRGNFYAPFLTWRHDGCSLQLYCGERHGEYTNLTINVGNKTEY